MIPDFVQQTIWDATDFYSCTNCSCGYCVNYAHRNKICSGVVKEPNAEVPYDIIRLCIKQTGYVTDIKDYTPDEAQSVIIVLSQSIADWMNNTEAYKRFRIR